MKRFITILLSVCVCCMASAQPDKWVKKATKAVFTLKTFNADGELIGSSNGFFITADGIAVSSYTPFRGASKAVVIDAMGKEYPVKSIIGANDTYDIAKFRVDANKCQTLRTAPSAAENTQLWILPPLARLPSKKGKRIFTTVLFLSLPSTAKRWYASSTTTGRRSAQEAKRCDLKKRVSLI